MPIYSIKHVLPDGSIAGYHGDSACSVVQKKNLAKTTSDMTSEKAAQWLQTVRQNFEFVWGDEEYRASPCWKGHSLEQIKTELEERPELISKERTLHWSVI